MADLMKMFGYGEKAAEAGVRMIIGEDEKTEYVVICRHNNKNYIKALTDIMQKNGKRLEYLEKSDPDSADRLNKDLMSEVLAKTICVKIGPGITFNGKKIPDTWQGRQEVLNSPTDFRVRCVEFSMDDDNYPLETDVEEIKKS